MAFAVAMVAAGVAAIAIVIPLRGSDTSPPVPTRQQLETYETALTPLAKRGGFVVQEGLKYGLSQVERDEGGPVVFQAVTWVDELEKVRKGFNAQGQLIRGTQLEPAITEFDAAFKLYIDAAQTIGAAAIASGEPRQKLLDEAAETGRAADLRYDRASALLQRLRQRRGLPITARFPSPRSTEQ